jgi:hypothetical protein
MGADKVFQARMIGDDVDPLPSGCASWDLVMSCAAKKPNFVVGNYLALFEKRVAKECRKEGGKLTKKDMESHLRFKCTTSSRKRTIWITSKGYPRSY